jgi:hypothetical protein
MCFMRAPQAPAVQEPRDRESDQANRAGAAALARQRSQFGESDTDIVGSIVSNDNRPQQQVSTQLKKLMGGTA